jgi:hypothetical protein
MSTQYHLYGNGGSGPINYASPIATVSALTWSSSALALGSSWRFGVRAFDTGTSLEEKNVDAQVLINVTAAGLDSGTFPAPPLLPSATPGVSGSIVVHWAYPITGKRPTGFHVYAGVTTPSFGSPAATVTYTPLPFFTATLTGFSDGQVIAVVVRAYNAAGEETNANIVTAIAAAAAPQAPDSLTAVATAQESA